MLQPDSRSKTCGRVAKIPSVNDLDSIKCMHLERSAEAIHKAAYQNESSGIFGECVV